MKKENLVLAAQKIIDAAKAAGDLARYDGVKYVPSFEDAKNIDELYKKTRTQFFDWETKKQIMLGNFVLLPENYDDYVVKARKILSKEKGGAK